MRLKRIVQYYVCSMMLLASMHTSFLKTTGDPFGTPFFEKRSKEQAIDELFTPLNAARSELVKATKDLQQSASPSEGKLQHLGMTQEQYKKKFTEKRERAVTAAKEKYNATREKVLTQALQHSTISEQEKSRIKQEFIRADEKKHKQIYEELGALKQSQGELEASKQSQRELEALKEKEAAGTILYSEHFTTLPALAEKVKKEQVRLPTIEEKVKKGEQELGAAVDDYGRAMKQLREAYATPAVTPPAAGPKAPTGQAVPTSAVIPPVAGPVATTPVQALAESAATTPATTPSTAQSEGPFPGIRPERLQAILAKGKEMEQRLQIPKDVEEKRIAENDARREQYKAQDELKQAQAAHAQAERAHEDALANREHLQSEAKRLMGTEGEARAKKEAEDAINKAAEAEQKLKNAAAGLEAATGKQANAQQALLKLSPQKSGSAPQTTQASVTAPVEAPTATVAGGGIRSKVTDLAGKASTAWKGLSGSQKGLVGAGVVAGLAAIAAATSAGVYFGAVHTQFIVPTADMLKGTNTEYDVHISYAAGAYTDFKLSFINGIPVCREYDKNKNFKAAKDTVVSVTSVKDAGKTVSVIKVTRHVWCVESVKVTNTKDATETVSVSVPLSSNRCKSHAYGLGRDANNKLMLTLQDIPGKN